MIPAKKTIPYLLVLCLSCNEKRPEIGKDPEPPKALKDEESGSFSISKRNGSSDLTEALYQENVKGSAELQQIETELQALHQAKTDSTVAFQNFHSKNDDYYGSANRIMKQLNDSILRDRLNILIQKSATEYSVRVMEHKALLEQIDHKGNNIEDLHHILKVLTTLPVMEKFQREQLPSSRPMRNHLKAQDSATSDLDAANKARGWE